MAAQLQQIYAEESEKIGKLAEKRKAHKMAFLELLENIVIKMK